MMERRGPPTVKLGMKTQLIIFVATSGLMLAGCNAGASASASAERGVKQVNSGLGDALQAPLEDLNLVREDIPEVLQQAVIAPYASTGMGRCAAISAEIARLDEALGPDLDMPPEALSTGDQTAEIAADVTLDAVRDTVTDFIPARSWIRRLTGAHQHSQAVQQAVQAGLQRRAFLKGLGQQKKCAPPAAPAHNQ